MNSVIQILKEKGAQEILKVFSLMFIVSLGLIFLSYHYFIEFSSFAVGLMKFSIAVTIFWAYDRFGIREISTMDLFKKNAVAYAIFLLGVAVIAAACIASS